MLWRPKQVKYLLSKRSPLSSKQEAKMKRELHANPKMGHKRKGSQTSEPKDVVCEVNVGTKFVGVFMDPDVAVDMAIAYVNRKHEGPPEIVGVVLIRTDSQTKWCPTIEKDITVKVEFDTKHDGVGLRA